MQYTQFDLQDTYKKLHLYLLDQLTKPTRDNPGYLVAILDKFITTLKNYENNESPEEMKNELLNQFETSDTPEISKRELLRSVINDIEGIDNFKAYLKDINF